MVPQPLFHPGNEIGLGKRNLLMILKLPSTYRGGKKKDQACMTGCNELYVLLFFSQWKKSKKKNWEKVKFWKGGYKTKS